MAGSQMRPEGQPRRLGVAESIAPDGAVVDDEPDADLSLVRSGVIGGAHGLHEVVVAVGLVHKPLAEPVHGDHAGFRAVDEMGEDAVASVGPWRFRDRRAGGGDWKLGMSPPADGFAEAHADAGVAFGHWAGVLHPGRSMGLDGAVVLDAARAATRVVE